ncbi:hypothetical protein [Nocardia seriolae]|uniref:DUF3284 domain-containing protein n=1 Tax=Nocardia seriolae TaxID=37332 RepID=A0A0B8N7R2_9NOCA|nr:hypothetical protein [Nocardia seriolae]APA99957.1 hypothetical protein NS506_05921 [Nocardia seriolae]MTJ64642.1 hypothetical protein [Nocardia seriolae]MTJ73047.1 hypothetical protein [Nocardia seriolae]MTJ89484.1 hypothetical protein [Nocardia seriolae]MTK33460.1 hypothetical protein [Nocardia seriolae]
MSRKHKYADSHFSIETRLSADRFAEITKHVGDSTKTLLGTVRFEGADRGRTNFSVRSMAGFYELLTFHVTIHDTATGSSGRSHIDTYKTTQQTYMFIPISPKTMNGYVLYRRFMKDVRAAVLAEDSRALVTISERGA